MNKVKFPLKNSSGSFRVEVGLELKPCAPKDIEGKINKWFEEVWSDENESWARVWSSGPGLKVERTELIRYADEFLSAPSVSQVGHSELKLCLVGARSSRLWKDWLITRIAPDLKAEFPYVGELLYIRNCGD